MRNNRLRKLLFCIAIFALGAHSCFADQEVGSVTGLPLPRFVSLKASETNLRKGPSIKQPIVWTYKRKGYPMMVIEEFENWRKLRDKDDSEGWVHENLITGARNAEVIGNYYSNKVLDYPKLENEVILFRYPDEGSYPMLRAEIGAIGAVKSCNEQWCKVRFGDTSGWIRKQNIWGVAQGELIK